MERGVTLHREKGVNPFLTYCRRCGSEANELILVGALDSITECGPCGIHLIGGGPCPKCGKRGTFVRKIRDGERLPASRPCDACEAELAEHAKVVAEGGIYFKCEDCPATGVIRASALLAELVRAKLGLTNGEPCGTAFSKADCPACGPKKGGEAVCD